MLREELCSSVKAIFKSYDAFLDIVEDGGPITRFETLCTINESPSNSMTYIIDTETGFFIGWYKLTHIGRSLSTNIKNLNDLNEFLINYLVEYQKCTQTFEEVNDDNHNKY